MKISWVISDLASLDPLVDINKLKEIGSLWGSWRTWRACQTDNVICNDLKKADELVKRAFFSMCNFYISNSMYATLNRPVGVKIYEGEFVHDVDRQEEIVSMHLAAVDSDIVLLLGFDFSERITNPDRLQEHRIQNYHGLTAQAIKNNPNVQWVAVDHPGQFRKDLLDLPNLTQDSMENVIGMLTN
jgi:hypothetical protein